MNEITNAGPVAKPEIVIITGLAGAGRETAAHALEDMGWYVVYNIAPQLIRTLYDLQAASTGGQPQFAVVSDPRSGALFSELPQVITELGNSEINPRVLFLEADENTLVRRFDSVRRPHPLQGEEGVIDGIRREKELLAPLRRMADLVIDTAKYNVHQLSMRMRKEFGSAHHHTVTINILSFGFKYGLPIESDYVADVRFLPNPYWVPELRALKGTEHKVSEYVFSQGNAEEFIKNYVEMLIPVLRGYKEENKQFATVAIGCTGGKHRSVAVSERLAEELKKLGYPIKIRHRDLGRE